ncbi:MAG: OB-fold nucleic acid binding domain-containing protein, partial [Candidatus Bathyarchaeia archaeon]
MDLEQIVQRILLIRRDLTREEVLKKIYEKKRSAEGYFLDEAAARIVAFELGVEIPKDEAETSWTELSIEKLVSGLNDVTVTGRVIIVYPAQTFSRQDLTEGRVARLLIADKTGTLKTVLWDDEVSLIEDDEIASEQIIRVLHGYVREGLDGKLELHVGTRGEIQISPPSVVESEYPPITSFIEKISAITGKRKKTNVLGVVQRVYPVSEFKRANGTHGKVRRLQLRDETGQITVVFWNQRVDELGDVETRDHLRIMNARVKELAGGLVELHVEKATQIEKVTEKLPSYEPKKTKRIVDIKEGEGPLTIEAKILTTPTVREVTTSRKENIKVANFDVTDGTGRINVSLWRRFAEFVKELSPGTRILLKNVYAKRGFADQLELTTRASTKIEVLSNSKLKTEG